MRDSGAAGRLKARALPHARWAAALTAICLFAAFLRLARLDAESVWSDEASTWRVTRATLATFNETILNSEVAPPFYYLVMIGWTRLAGDTGIALRLPSALAGILTVAALGLLARRLLGRGAGLAAGLLLAASPMHIWYSQEGRSYTFFVLLISLSTLALAHALRRGGRLPWLAYFAATLAAWYTHYFAAYFIAAQGLIVLYAAVQARRARLRSPLKPWLACLAAVAVLWLPWLPSFLRTPWGFVGWIEGLWADTSPLYQLGAPVRDLVLGRAYPEKGLAAMVGPALAAGLGLVALWPRRRGGQPPGLAVVSLMACAPILMAWAVSLYKPSLIPRYVLPALPFLLALIAWGALRIRPAWAGLLMLGLFLGVQFWSLGRDWANPSRPDWRGLAAYVREHEQPGDGAMADHYFYNVSLDYYLGEEMSVVLTAPDRAALNRMWFVEVPGSGRGVQGRLTERFPVEIGPKFRGLNRLVLFQLEGTGPHYRSHD